MKEFNNTLNTAAMAALKSLVGARLILWGQPFPQDERASRQRAFEHIRLETSRGTVVMSLVETDAFPETCVMEVLEESAWREMIEKNDSLVKPAEWYSTRIDRIILSIRVFTDTGTDVRGSSPDETVVRDACGVAFELDDGTALLFEKTYSGSEVWDVSRPRKDGVLISERNPGNIDSETIG